MCWLSIRKHLLDMLYIATGSNDCNSRSRFVLASFTSSFSLSKFFCNTKTMSLFDCENTHEKDKTNNIKQIVLFNNFIIFSFFVFAKICCSVSFSKVSLSEHIRVLLFFTTHLLLFKNQRVINKTMQW